MPADYSKFRTPFYEIEIGNTLGKNMKPLPPQIARLIERVEITETLCCNSFNQITITFIEGSREPFKVTKGQYAPQDIYPSGGEGLLSNQSGMLVDLRMSTGGLTSTIPNLKALVPAFVGKALDALGGSKNGKSNDIPAPVLEEEEIPVKKENIHFLFEQRNQVKVTWGYKEDPLSRRVVRGYIMMVSSEFPENGTPKVTIVCHDGKAIADQLVTKNAKSWGNKISSGASESNSTMFEFEDLPIEELIPKIAGDIGIDYISSDSYIVDSPGEGYQVKWMPGESLHQFLSRMSRLFNAHYEIKTNPKTGEDILIFMSREDWEKYPVISDHSLMTYRGNGSILKSVNITADYGAPVESFMKSINEEGGIVSVENRTVGKPLFDAENQQANNPLSSNTPPLASGIDKMAGGTSGAVAVSPDGTPAVVKAKAANNTMKQAGNIVALEFSTLGFTKLSPGNIKFSGIGDRYTGVYHVERVTHTLDSSGYNCKGYATSFKNAQGGVNPKGNVKKESSNFKESQLIGAIKEYRDTFLS